MHFNDLALCSYHPGPCDASSWTSPLLSVGWLEHPHSYPVGRTPQELLERLEALIAASWEHFPSFAFRGLHECSLCASGKPAEGRPTRSHENLWIPGDGVIYIAPGMITHYIGDHSYLPPEGFIRAVLTCPDYGSPAYHAALLVANSDKQPPLLTKQQVAEKWSKEREMLAEHKRQSD
jgi:hypothetical protein